MPGTLDFWFRGRGGYERLHKENIVANFKKLDSVSDNDVIEFSESTFKIKKLKSLIAESILASFGSILESLMKRVSPQDKNLGESLIRQISSANNPLNLNNLIAAQLLQANGEWKPCKIRMKLELEVYTEETEVNVGSSEDQEDPISPLDDIRKSIAQTNK